jgi:flagellum-specific peptidoglycan hydrolase FlgJ
MEGMVKIINKDEFIAYLAPIAVQVRYEGSPMFPSVRLAQNLLETGGKVHSWKNLGGIKVGSGTPNEYWRGEIVHKGTWEVYDGQREETTAAFRAYDSVYDFYKDQDLLLNRRRYDRVRAAGTPSEQANALYQSGYATDPQYASKLISLIASYGLTQYDKEAEDIIQLREEVEELKKQVQTLQERIYMPEIPDWAEEAVKAAVEKGIVHNPEGRSFDFYSVITVMHRNGVI